MSARLPRIPPFARDGLRIENDESRSPLSQFRVSLQALARAIHHDIAPSHQMPRAEMGHLDVMEGPGTPRAAEPLELTLVAVDLTRLMKNIEGLPAPAAGQEPDRHTLATFTSQLMRPWASIHSGRVVVDDTIRRELQDCIARAKSAGLIQ